MALALSTTFLAWRLRAKLSQLNGRLAEDVSTRDTMLRELDAATTAFEEAFLAIEGDTVRLVWGGDTLTTVARALNLKDADDEAPAVVKALGDLSPEAAKGLNALILEGRSCRFEVFAEAPANLKDAPLRGLSIIVEGKASGSTAWLRLAIAGAKPSLSSGPFAQMAEKWPAPCWISGRDGRTVWANAAWLKAAEAPSMDMVFAQNISLDRSVDALVSEAREHNERREGYRWIPIGGQRRAFQVVAEPLNETYVCAYAIDVTESEESRDALKRHAAAHDETLNLLEDAVAIFGPEKQLMFHNRAFELLWELEPAWLAERPTHGEWLDRLRQKRRLPETSDYSGFKSRELDFYGLTQTSADEMWSLPDGRALRVVRQPHPLGGLLVLFSDKTGELSLKAQFNSLIQVQKATLDQLSDAVSVFGSDGRLRLRNHAFEAFWNIPAEDMEAAQDFSAVAELCLPLVHDQGFWADLRARVTDIDPVTRAPQRGELKLADSRIVQWRTQPLPDGAMLIVFSDVTATRSLEQAIEARDEALNESVRLKRDFVANVSYELRTPLTTIVGYADMLHSDAVDVKKQKDYLSAIQSAAQQLAGSINDVLDMAQIDAGEMQIARTEIDLHNVVAEAALRLGEAFSARKVRFDYDGVREVGTIRADGEKLSRILEHLLGYTLRNASADTAVTLSAVCDVGTLKLEVGYRGRGIPYHMQAHIFDRFVGRERGGPGLSLALVKALVELHDGWITLESEPDEGARFHIHLPAQVSKKSDEAA